jgi:hypothetical protein
MIRRKTLTRKAIVGGALAAVVALAFATSNALAQPEWTGTSSVSDEQNIGYGVTGNTDDTVVNITMPQEDADTPNFDMCAMIYVLDAHQLLQECCGCYQTADGLRTIKVRSGLFDESKFTAPPLAVGVIRVVSATPNGCEYLHDPQNCDTNYPSGNGNLSEVCDATGGTYPYGQYHGLNPQAGPGFNFPYPNTHGNSGIGNGSILVERNLRVWGTHNQNGAITESEFEENPLTQDDANSLAETCGDIQSSGSSRTGICDCGVGD